MNRGALAPFRALWRGGEMATKPKVTDVFISMVREGVEDCGQSSSKRLEFLLPLYRKIQSAVLSGQAKLAYLDPIITKELQRLEDLGGQPEYITSSKRTMGMLVYKAKPISGEGASSKAKRIRRFVARSIGKSASERVVTVRTSVIYRIDWRLISSGGQGLVDRVRFITGMKKDLKPVVREVTKRAKLGKTRKGR